MKPKPVTPEILLLIQQGTTLVAGGQTMTAGSKALQTGLVLTHIY